MNFSSSIACALAFSSFVAPIRAQGADSCANAQPTGPVFSVPFDLTAATNSAAPAPACGAIERDVWFRWTPPFSGIFRVSTCAPSTAPDLRLAVYWTQCPTMAGVELACGDNECGTSSEVYVSVVGCQSYLVRVGVAPGTPAGTGTLRFIPETPVVDPATGDAYLRVPRSMSWSQARAFAEGLTWSDREGGLARLDTPGDLAFVQAVLNLGADWTALVQDTTVPGFAEPAGGWVWMDRTGAGPGGTTTSLPAPGVPWAPGEPDDLGPLAGAADYAVLVGGAGGAAFHDLEAAAPNSTGFIVEFPEERFGTVTCLGVPNSTGAPATLHPRGLAFTAAGSLQLEARNVPPGSFGFLLTSGIPAFSPGVGLSTGTLCLGGSIGRFVQQIQPATPSGHMSFVVNLGAVPTPLGPTLAVPCQRPYFQTWYRDVLPGGGTTSNFTDAVQVFLQ